MSPFEAQLVPLLVAQWCSAWQTFGHIPSLLYLPNAFSLSTNYTLITVLIKVGAKRPAAKVVHHNCSGFLRVPVKNHHFHWILRRPAFDWDDMSSRYLPCQYEAVSEPCRWRWSRTSCWRCSSPSSTRRTSSSCHLHLKTNHYCLSNWESQSTDGKCKPLMISGRRSRLWITGLHWSANFWSSRDITLFPKKNLKLHKMRKKGW